jgi:hypothetical protein
MDMFIPCGQKRSWTFHMNIQENEREVLMKARGVRTVLVRQCLSDVIIRGPSVQERAASFVSTQLSHLSILQLYCLMTKVNTLCRSYDQLFCVWFSPVGRLTIGCTSLFRS